MLHLVLDNYSWHVGHLISTSDERVRSHVRFGHRNPCQNVCILKVTRCLQRPNAMRLSATTCHGMMIEILKFKVIRKWTQKDDFTTNDVWRWQMHAKIIDQIRVLLDLFYWHIFEFHHKWEDLNGSHSWPRNASNVSSDGCYPGKYTGGCPPSSNSCKWRFIGVSYQKWNYPVGERGQPKRSCDLTSVCEKSIQLSQLDNERLDKWFGRFGGRNNDNPRLFTSCLALLNSSLVSETHLFSIAKYNK